MDVTNKPAALRRYKIQPGTNEPVESKKLMKVILTVLFNQIVVGLPFAYVSLWLMTYRGLQPIRELPTFHWVLFEMAILILVEEIGFYYSHRFLHNRYLYRVIHKKHHEWTAPIAVTAVYCHPIEHIFSNLLPPFLGVLLMGSHVATAWLWFSLAILSTLNAHSGIHPIPKYNHFINGLDNHGADVLGHMFNQCYGVLGLMDRLHGTDSVFRSTQAYSRHIMMLSLVPPREVFPDPDKCKSK
ncbi:hypothetical protein J437_LFUL008082 [Ladona fulva]|uniref:Fatty acid hydroxylase domain-containing protein n=1 Tax=Ladona fulva TaxID=123851 RepID=A0A8K0KAN8_LADFU|nr:hypothetical protein J437_LFUL008082 [Ladona fulva]